MFDGAAISDNGDGRITLNMTNSYRYSDSLYITFLYVDYDADEEECLSDYVQTFIASNSTCTYFNGWCYVFVLTKQ